ncbi:predicted protein [Lichtheimia corymbifera JMRC:FSU:9682]|uniref:Uncharacterized protein n=1 Tax=Lichtheimia corymbifera JMRC:FSU:9682 TaxID=1263082 RepID=A0A068S7K2_9FUNG|nr:predicted protein [Lichtheimia corymbifera JMRC:FSU:9682]
MSCGLSSIIDLIDLSKLNKQASGDIISASGYYLKKLESRVRDGWITIHELSLDDGWTRHLSTFDRQKSAFDKDLCSRWTESDYIVKIWGPIIESILAINNSKIRLKTGESVNNISSQTHPSPSLARPGQATSH